MRVIASRLLVILGSPLDCAGAAGTIERASLCAARPLALRFAVPEAVGSAGLPANADVFFYNEAVGLSSLLPLLTDETHFLLIGGAHAFAPKWDARLFGILRTLDASALLTGMMRPCPLPAHPVPASDASTARLSGLTALRQALPELQKRRQAGENAVLKGCPPAHFQESLPTVSEAVLPALKSSTDSEHVAIGQGLSMVCAKAPVKTLLLNPALVYGPVSFLQAAETNLSTLSLAAYVSGYSVHALHEALLWPLAQGPVHHLSRPPQDAMPGTTLSRFEQLLGFHFGQADCTSKSAMGLFGPDETYPQRMPRKLRIRHSARAAWLRLKEQHLPLMVSAFIDLPSRQQVPSYYYRLRFGFLRRMESLPLLLYTGGAQERALRSAFAHTQSYPDNSVLPRVLLQQGMTPEEHFARSKPLLMLNASKKQAEFSHIAWLDMDILPHPVCPEAVPDLRPLMDDRIHLATVSGVPDGSFVVIPKKLLPRVAREASSITQLDAELKRGFSEALFWQRLFEKKPGWFAIHPMPRRRLLFVSTLDRQLLSVPLQSLLGTLPPVYYASQADTASPADMQKGATLNARNPSSQQASQRQPR